MVLALQAAATQFNPNLVVLGLVAQLLAGALFTSAVARSQPRQLLQELLGSGAPDLSALRGAILSRIQNQAGSLCFCLGVLLLLFAFLLPSSTADWRLEVFGALVLAAGLAVFLIVSQRLANRLLRRYLREQLRRKPIVFEDHVALTREIGQLFGVESRAEDTLESYCARLRAALGIQEPPSRAVRGAPPRYYGYGKASDSIFDTASSDSV